MTSEGRDLFLAEAYRFLSNISYGRNTSISHSQSEEDNSDYRHNHDREKFRPVPHLPKVRKLPPPRQMLVKSFAEWAATWHETTATTKSIRRRNCLQLISSPEWTCTYRTSLLPYLPPALRRIQETNLRFGHRTSLFILKRPQAGKVRSYRHLLRRLRALEKDRSTKSESDHEYSTSSSTSSSGRMDSSEEDELAEIEQVYDPEALDNPELRSGQHRTVINLTFYLASINHYTKADLLKREVNEKFRKLHPRLDPTLTLTQIRNLKSRLLEIALAHDLEAVTVARAFVYLEKLILARTVGKVNRRLIGGCCLVLAAKATDSKGMNYDRLLTGLSSRLAVLRDDLVAFEFPVWARLGFRLQVGEEQYGVHLHRILDTLDYSTVREYLEERMWKVWQEATTTTITDY